MSKIVQDVAEKCKGKKPKVKKLEGKLEGTKAIKLDKEVQAELEKIFPAAKLRNVKVHVGGNAQKLCKEVKAKAFTLGNDIVFEKPGNAKDKKLLAHELVHVLQQGKGRMPKAQAGKVYVTK